MRQHPYTKVISNVVSQEYGDYIVLKGAVMREHSYIKWLEECIKEIKFFNNKRG